MSTVDLKKFEVWSQQKAAPLNYIIIRSDGVAFHTLTKEMDLDKPFDDNMHSMMVNTTLKLMEEFEAVMGYTQSDEISIMIDRESGGRPTESVAATVADQTRVKRKSSLRVVSAPKKKAIKPSTTKKKKAK